MIISHADPPTVLLDNVVPWFMIQTNLDRNGNDCTGNPPVLATEWFHRLINQIKTAGNDDNGVKAKRMNCRNIATMCLKTRTRPTEKNGT